MRPDTLARLSKEERRLEAKLQRLELQVGSRDVGCQAARRVRRWKTKGTEALDELGVHLEGAPEVSLYACGHIAGELVVLPSGAKVWACGHHARQHETSVAGKKLDRCGQRTRSRARRVLWLERSACLAPIAAADSEEDFRKLWNHAVGTLTPEALADHNAREIAKGNRAVRAWVNRQRAAAGEWPFPDVDDQEQLTFTTTRKTA